MTLDLKHMVRSFCTDFVWVRWRRKKVEDDQFGISSRDHVDNKVGCGSIQTILSHMRSSIKEQVSKQ